MQFSTVGGTRVYSEPIRKFATQTQKPAIKPGVSTKPPLLKSSVLVLKHPFSGSFKPRKTSNLEKPRFLVVFTLCGGRIMFAEEEEFTDLTPYSVIYQISKNFRQSKPVFYVSCFKLICPYRAIKNLPHHCINDNLKTLQTSGLVSSYGDSCKIV